MKKTLALIFSAFIVFAAQMRIKSQKFFYDSKTLQSVFTGEVNATKGKDNILSDKMIVFFDKNKKPIKFEAIGDVRFFFVMDKNSTYRGRCDRLIYYIKNGNIVLIGNAFIKRLETNESISGEKIKMNKFTKDINVMGGEKPVNIIIKVNGK
jgi:lipopolysaccharide export system protein LptA